MGSVGVGGSYGRSGLGVGVGVGGPGVDGGVDEGEGRSLTAMPIRRLHFLECPDISSHISSPSLERQSVAGPRPG